MRRAMLVISGFSEKMGHPSGSRILFESVVFPLGHMGDHGQEAVPYFRQWNADWKQFALFLNSLGIKEVFVAAYSWGAGYGLKKFAKHFEGQVTAVLSDPVFRSKTIFGRLLAFFDRTIFYPSNVKVVKWFYQKQNEPGGDKVMGAPKGIELLAKHSQMDDHQYYHDSVEEELNKWLTR